MTAKSDSGVKTVKKRKVRDTSLDKGQTVKKKKKNDRQNPESPKKKQFKDLDELTKARLIKAKIKASLEEKKRKKAAGENVPKKTKKRKTQSDKKTDGGAKKLEEMTPKDRKKHRRMQKNNYEKISRMKNIWEQVRRHELNEEKRKDLINQLFKLCKGHMTQFVMAHDTSRIIQCLLKFGTAEQKAAIFEEVQGSIGSMCKSKYAKFLVIRFLKYGTKEQRNTIMSSFHGNVKKFIRHQEASEVVESLYNDYANAAQRTSLLEEFYGPTFTLFKTPEVRTLESVLTTNPEKKATILNNIKEALTSLTDKAVLRHSMVHKAFLEFFTFASDKQKSEMVENIREKLIEMLHTRDGAKVAMNCIWNGTAKDRKVIIKSMKTFVVKICKEEHGHLVLLALFDVVDDTKILQKVIIEEMMKSVYEVATDKHGIKVLLYLVSPRDPVHFHPDFVKLLEPGDNNPHSKKDCLVRRQELVKAASKPILQCIIDHIGELGHNNSALLFIVAAVKHTTEDASDVFRAVSTLASDKDDNGSFPFIENSASHILMKRLIANDKERIEAGKSVLFSTILLDTLPPGRVLEWTGTNRGCFTLLSVLEVNYEDLTQRIQKELKNCKKKLSKSTFPGAKLLVKKLS